MANTGKQSALMRAATSCFAAGMVAVVVILVLFALGRTDLPWWLSVSAVGFASVGFLLGLIALLREARSA